jgi:hypothetical protein
VKPKSAASVGTGSTVKAAQTRPAPKNPGGEATTGASGATKPVAHPAEGATAPTKPAVANGNTPGSTPQ